MRGPCLSGWKLKVSRAKEEFANFGLFKNQISNKLCWFEWHQRCLTSREVHPKPSCVVADANPPTRGAPHGRVKRVLRIHSRHITSLYILRRFSVKELVPRLHGSRGPVELPKNTWNLSSLNVSRPRSSWFHTISWHVLWYLSFQNVDTWPYLWIEASNIWYVWNVWKFTPPEV